MEYLWLPPWISKPLVLLVGSKARTLLKYANDDNDINGPMIVDKIALLKGVINDANGISVETSMHSQGPSRRGEVEAIT